MIKLWLYDMNIIKYISYNYMIWVMWLYNYMIKFDHNYVIIIMIISPFMLSTFSCTCCPFICLHWKNVFSIPLAIFNQIILFLFLVLSCVSSLYILDTNLLSAVWFPDTFSPSIGCLLILWVVFVCLRALEKLFTLM